MANKDLVRFILEAKRRGFSDSKIREALLSNRWPVNEINSAFESLREPANFKEKLSLWLDPEVMKRLEKRAKKNMLNIQEQAEDIIRRSIANAKPSKTQEKLDDMLVGLFSRKRK